MCTYLQRDLSAKCILFMRTGFYKVVVFLMSNFSLRLFKLALEIICEDTEKSASSYVDTGTRT